MQTSSFNLVQTSAVLVQRWKTILLFTIACAVIATATVFIVPPYYRSSATVVPGNAALADKGRIFNQNIKDLYSYFGTGDDLDRVHGLANRQLSYLQLVDEFSLVEYYHLSGDSLNILRKKASLRLQKCISLTKTEEGQLRITAWTKNKQLSADLVTRLIFIIQETAKKIWQENYLSQIGDFDKTLASLQREYVTMLDSVKLAGTPQPLYQIKLQQLQERMQHFSRLSDEFKLASVSLPPVLYVTEPAVPAAFAERPDKVAIIVATCLLAFVFSCIVVLVNDRKTSV